MPDAGSGEPLPRKSFTGVDIATRLHLRMRKHIVLPNAVPPGDAAAEPNYGLNLIGEKVTVAENVSGIDDLDADRRRIDVGPSSPRTFSGMPCAVALAHHLRDPAVLMNEVVGRNFADRITEPGLRRLPCFHSRVVKNDHFRQRLFAPHPEIGGRLHFGPWMVRRKSTHTAALRPLSISS